MMFKMIDFLIAGFVFAGILVNPSTCQPNENTKCLMHLDEVREVLGSKIPPINDSRMTDNYYNMSRALFPSVDLPALYVRVTLQFLKDYQNGTKMIDDQKKNLKFTWSKACSYVSGNKEKHISLVAMSVFSLATILPQRRESELVMTVPPFCHSSPYAKDDIETWKYVVSTLEDIIINPKISDPRLNTACCVLIGHESDMAEYPNLWYFYWLILSSSFLAGFSLWIFLLNSITDGMNKDLKDNTRSISGAALKMTCLIAIMFLVELILLFCFECIKTDGKMFIYSGVYVALCVVSFIIGCCWNYKYDYYKYCSVTNRSILEMYQVGFYFLFPCLFQTVHHFLWVVCGIISEPFWATPIFLLECLLASSILFVLFIYEKEYKQSSQKPTFEEGKPGDKFLHVYLFLCWVSFVLVLITIALIAVNSGNTGPTAGVIEAVMTGIFFWLVKISKTRHLCPSPGVVEGSSTGTSGHQLEVLIPKVN